MSYWRCGRCRSVFSARSFFRDPVDYVEAHGNGRPTLPLSAGPARFLLVRDPELVWGVLVTNADSFAPGKWKRRARRFVGPALNTLHAEEHRRRRLLLQPAFDRRRIASFEDSIAERVERVSAEWEDGAQIELRDTLDRLSLSVAGELLLSAELDPTLADDLRDIVAALPRLRPPLRLTAGGRALARAEAAVQALIDARRLAPEQDDLVGVLLRSDLPDRTIRGDVIACLHAALDEPPSALEAVWYLLGHHSEADARLHAELLHGEDAYPEAVLFEAMRLYPPARHIDRCPVHDVQIGEVRVPKGSRVLVSPLVTHADARLYERPASFVPERWLDSRGPKRGSYLPFGAGVHTCIGQPLAWAIMKTTLATIARRWRLQIGPDAPRPVPRSPRLLVTLQRR